MTQLPVAPAGSWFAFSTELNGVTYGFEFLYNERVGYWYVTLLDSQGNAIVSGRKVVLGSLFRNLRGTLGVMQDGDVYVIDTDDGTTDAGLDDLGGRVVLIYATDVELAAAFEAA